MQAPTLFVIAADLTKMQVNANIDESDVGRMRPGQVVHFRVDAYPTEEFAGTVAQVRLNPTTVQNVVTYSTVIDVPNPDLEVEARDDGQREYRDCAPPERAARAERGAAVPSDARHVPGAQSGGDAGHRAGDQRGRIRSWPRRPECAGCRRNGCAGHASRQRTRLQRISGRGPRRVWPRGRRQPVGWLPAPVDNLRAR